MIDKLKGKIFNRKRANFSFAQAGEDLVLQRIFLGVEKGIYVDVGAYHPYKFSNTYLFYLNGWRGINIEPRPHSKRLFDKVRPEDVNLEIGVAEKSGMRKYYLFAENTLNQFAVAGALDESDYRQVITMQVEPLSTILQNHLGSHRIIDFVSIDTEGAEYEVLSSHNWIDFLIKVVVVEQNKNNHSFHKVAELLHSKQYREAYRVPVNKQADSVFFIMKDYA